MSEPKWTPGPWHIEERLLVYAGTKWVASAKMYDREMSLEEAQANAHLIAAAPDLYRVCKKWDKVLRRGVASLTDDEWDELAAETWKALRKARGESNGD